MTMTREQVAALLDDWLSGHKGIPLVDAAPDLARTALSLMDRLADADMAQAAMVDRVEDTVTALWKWDDEGWLVQRPTPNQVKAAIRRLAPDAGVKALAEWKRLAVAGELTARELAIVEADRDRLAKRLKETAAECGVFAAELAEARAKIDQMTAAWGKDALEVEELTRLQEAATLALSDMEMAFKPGTSVVELIRLGTGAALRLRAALAAANPIPNVSAGWPLEEGDGSVMVGKVKAAEEEDYRPD